MGAIRHSSTDVDGHDGAPTILLVHGFPSAGKSRFALATAAGEIASLVDDFFSNATQRQRLGAAEPRI